MAGQRPTLFTWLKLITSTSGAPAMTGYCLRLLAVVVGLSPSQRRVQRSHNPCDAPHCGDLIWMDSEDILHREVVSHFASFR